MSSGGKKNEKRQDPSPNIDTHATFLPQYIRYAQNLFSSTFLCMVGQQASIAHHYEGNTLVLQGLAEPCLQMMELWNGTTIDRVHGTIRIDRTNLYLLDVPDIVRASIPTVATAGL